MRKPRKACLRRATPGHPHPDFAGSRIVLVGPDDAALRSRIGGCRQRRPRCFANSGQACGRACRASQRDR
jgi:hypothetical protein